MYNIYKSMCLRNMNIIIIAFSFSNKMKNG